MKIIIADALDGSVIDSIDSEKSTFQQSITFFKRWELARERDKMIGYIDKGEDLILKTSNALFTVEWP